MYEWKLVKTEQVTGIRMCLSVFVCKNFIFLKIFFVEPRAI